MKIERITVGILETNCYLLHEEEDCIIIDPGNDEDRIISLVDSLRLKPKKIVATHCHFDHVSAVKTLKDVFNIPFYIHEDDLVILRRISPERIFKEWGIKITQQPEPDGFLKNGDTIKIGDSELAVIHTPGHTPGHIVLRGSNFLISGDLLFKNGIGRTDFFGGDINLMKKSLRETFKLPDHFVVYPGHGPPTTIGAERKNMAFYSLDLT